MPSVVGTVPQRRTEQGGGQVDRNTSGEHHTLVNDG